MNEVVFRPRVEILRLLGEQLIANKRLAIFELVKNAYDADASEVEVLIKYPDNSNAGYIEISDNGTGMKLDILKNVWFEPGNRHKLDLKSKNNRTSKYNRLPLGDKGVGRFAVHKLGDYIKINTKAIDDKEYEVEINWKKILSKKYLDQMPIQIKEVPTDKRIFSNNESGTKILIKDLRETLNRNDIRDLYRSINSIISPYNFNTNDNFNIKFKVPEHEDWLCDLCKIDDIFQYSLFHFTFCISEKGEYSYVYEYTPNEQLQKYTNIGKKSSSGNNIKLIFPKKPGETAIKDKEFFKDFGEINGEFYVYDFDPKIQNFYTNTQFVKSYLKNNGGLRIYRDNIRVYNYGEPDDDWLELDSRRINRIGKGINNRLILGAIFLDLASSSSLIEKTNREGFIDNNTYKKFQNTIIAVLSDFENKRHLDKSKLKNILDKGHVQYDIEEPISQLNKLIEKKYNHDEDLKNRVQCVKSSYEKMRDIMLKSGMTGLNFSVTYHEILHGIDDAVRILEEGENINLLKTVINRVSEMISSYNILLKRDSIKPYKLSELTESIVNSSKFKFKRHGINLHYKLDSMKLSKEPEIKLSKQYIAGALANIIDNSIYWMDVSLGEESINKHLLIDIVLDEFDSGPAIIIADNGPGFRGIPADDLTTPFFSTKPDGIGLGLYYVKNIIHMYGGDVFFGDRTKIQSMNLDKRFSGAVVAIIFKKK